MDKPQHDKGPEVVQVSASSRSQPSTATGKSLFLPWLFLGALALLIAYGKNDGPTNQRDGRDARLGREYSGDDVPDRSATACAAWGKLAEQAMRFRQTGGSKAGLLDVIDKSGSQENRMLAHAIVDDAYSSALHSDPDLQAASILAFRSVVEDTCSNSG